MESVFNIEPEDIVIRDNILDNKYTFLDETNIPLKDVYYTLVNTLINYKLKNLYKFIYLRLYRINREYSKIKIIDNIKHSISPNVFNNILKEFINRDRVNAIIIMNAIQLYLT